MELPKRKQNRVPEFDYGTPNVYFITICTEKRKKLFWMDVGAAIGRPEDVPFSVHGRIVRACIEEIPKHYPAVAVDRYVVMPNHVHLLLRINAGHDGRPMVAPTISTVVNQLKGAASKRIGFPVWQKGFYDHVVRGERDYLEIWEYIEGNPGKWAEDELYG